MPLARIAGVAAILALAVVFALTKRSELPSTWSAARSAQPLLLGFAAILTAAFYANLAAFYAASYRAVGLRTPVRDMAWLTLGSSFVNMVSKSGGMGGLALFLADARRRNQPRGQVVTAYVLNALLGHLAFALLLAAALLVVWFDGHLTRTEALAGGLFTLYFAAQLVVLGAGLRSRSALRYVHAAPGRVLGAVKRKFGRETPRPGPDHEAADELYDAISLLIRRPRSIAVPAIHALLVEALGVLTIWAVLFAFGQHPGLQLPLVAYAISVLFSIVGVLPAGLGFAEASMGTVLVAYGIASPIAIVAVLTYRVFEVWLPFAIGGFAAQHLARRRSEA